MRNFKLFAQIMTLMSGLLFFAGCQQETVSPNASIEDRDSRPTLTPGGTTSGYYGLGPSNQVMKFSLRPAYSMQATVPIQGMRAGESLVAIDTRPATRSLYGVSSMSRIYLIDPASGLTKPLSQANFSPAIDGATVGFDFNPTTDRITLVTDKGQTLSIHPSTGQVVAIGTTGLTGVNGITYYGDLMYAIDATTGIVSIVDASGNTKPIGTTGLTIAGEGGFDSKGGLLLSVLNASGVVQNASSAQDDLTQQNYRLYSVDPTTGQVTNLGIVPPMIGLAAQ